jgi:hypothetical protein
MPVVNRRAPAMKVARLAATHADIDFKRLLPRQSAQALPDMREARLVRVL